MKNRMKLVVLGAVLAAGAGSAHAQDSRRGEAVFAPSFFFDAMSYASEQANKSRIDFYVQIPYHELRFSKEGDQFVARYDVALIISSADKKLLQDRSWSVDVRVQEFEQTLSKRLYSLSHQSLEVDPGNYQISVTLKDQESRVSGKTVRALPVSAYRRGSMSLSDIMLVSRLTTTSDGKTKIVPNISGNVGAEGKGFFLFFEVYDTTAGIVALTAKVYNEEKDQLWESSLEQHVSGTRTQAFMKIDSLSVPVGTYIVTVEATRPGTTGSGASTSRTFAVRWTDIPFSVTDLRKAVDQLRYIAQPSEYERLRDSETDEIRKERFLEFWTKRDPDPSTARNELMEEYYQRVEYANKNFGHFTEGWRTDMGMVFIRFGAPENIERHPFDTGSKPFEVWYYYSLERQFVFVDETGFGDYRLRYPTTDLWGRIR